MFVTEYEDRQMALKPMNCPGHCQLYSMQPPLLPRAAAALLGARPAAPPRAERAPCTACCASATSPRTTPTSSAPRTRSRTRSPACCDFAFATYRLFGFDVRLELSTRPEQRIGSDELWDHERGGAARRARRATASSTSSTRATAPSTARRSTCT